MSHPADPDKLSEILGNELGAVVRNDPCLLIRVLLTCSLDDDLHITFGHRLSNFPMNNETTVAVQLTAQVIEGAANIEI